MIIHRRRLTLGPRIDDPIRGQLMTSRLCSITDHVPCPRRRCGTVLRHSDVVEVQARGRPSSGCTACGRCRAWKAERELDALRFAPDSVVADWPSVM